MSRKETIATIAGVIVAALALFLVVPPGRRTTPRSLCTHNLRQINGATLQWALENKAPVDAVVTWNDIRPYLGRGSVGPIPVCPNGGTYTIGRVCDLARCSIMSHNLTQDGWVKAYDPAGQPVPDVRLTVWSNATELCFYYTSTNGEAYLFSDPAVSNLLEQAGSVEFQVGKAGYRADRFRIPTNDWPILINLKRE